MMWNGYPPQLVFTTHQQIHPSFISNPYVPRLSSLNEMTQPVDLAQFVLKPLFSFAGMGVCDRCHTGRYRPHYRPGKLDTAEEGAMRLSSKQWMNRLKRKYACFFWKTRMDRPKAVHNLARL